MLVALLIIIVLIIIANLIYVTPPIKINDVLLPEGRDDDIEKIGELEQLFATGWGNGSGFQYASAFAENADYITFNGQWVKGRQAIDDVHQKLFDSVLKGSTVENRKIRSIRFISDEAAIVHVTGAIKQQWRKKAAASRMSIQTLVAIKFDNEWKFTAFHNARIKRFTLWDGMLMSFK